MANSTFSRIVDVSSGTGTYTNSAIASGATLYWEKIGNVCTISGVCTINSNIVGDAKLADNIPSARVGNVPILTIYGEGGASSTRLRVDGSKIYSTAQLSSGTYMFSGSYLAS